MFGDLVHGFYAVETHTRDTASSTLNNVDTRTRDSGENFNAVGGGGVGHAGEVEAHDINIGRQVAGALLADNVESASETTQKLSETIQL